MMEAMGSDTGPSTWAITHTQWATGYNIWLFKVMPAPIGGPHSKQVNGDIPLKMMFASALTANMTLLVMSEERATLDIAQFNHVLI